MSIVKSLEELINNDEPGIDLVRQWTESAKNQCEVLPPSLQRDDVLLEVQVTTRSPMGAVAFDTGGILIDHGWLRFLGSGHPKLPRTLPGWNDTRANGFYLVADDMAGGFFALNGGAFGDEVGIVHFWSPDDLEWECLDMGYSDLLNWALNDDLPKFYDGLRWESWQADIAKLSGDQSMAFYPFLWTEEGSAESSHRGAVPVTEAFDLKCDIVRQLGQ